ncbi:MAG: flagellar protein FliT [Chloroflexota bacterium]|nr:MAG: flagellar protein FliT [Chloroflexota bacterium]
MGASHAGGSMNLSQRLLELAEEELASIRQGDFDDFVRYLEERQATMNTLDGISPESGQRESVVVSLKRVQAIDREIEMLLGSLLEATRRDMEELRAGRRLLHRYSEDQERPLESHLDVKG